MGGTAKKITNVGGRVLGDVATGGLAEFGKKDPWYGLVTNPSTGARAFAPGGGASNPSVPGPFGLDPAQMAKDQADITGLGNKQYADTLGAIDTNTAAQTQHAKDLFGQMLPNIAENAQAAHLYDSTGYGQEVARQQSGIASQLASDAAQQKMQALQGRQGFETGALQRGQSLEDFINQANVAKSIGAQVAPQMPSGKATGLSGGVAGAGAGAPFGPMGAAIGGGAGLIMGSQANRKGGK